MPITRKRAQQLNSRVEGLSIPEARPRSPSPASTPGYARVSPTPSLSPECPASPADRASRSSSGHRIDVPSPASSHHSYERHLRPRLTPYNDSDIESVPSLSPPTPQSSGHDPWVPYSFPSFPDDIVIEEWEVIGVGVHGEVRRVRTTRGQDERVSCFKLYTEQNYDAYLREADAYMLLEHQGVRRCVPDVYFMQKWPRWKWDGNQPDEDTSLDRNEQLYGLVMEYFEDCERINLRRATLRLAEVIGSALERIHSACVVHRDIADRNLLLVRENGRSRVVWIDFSCSWCGPEFKETTLMEWDEFRGFIYDGMDPRDISAEILNEKFPAKRLYHPPERRFTSPLASSTRSQSSIRIIPVSGERGLLPLRLAYGTFFLVHIVLAVASLTGLPLNRINSAVLSDETVFSTLSLALIFAIGRNAGVKETEYGRGLLAIFLAYGVITLTYLLYHSFISRGWEGPRSPGPSGILSWIFIVCNLFWIVSAAEAARCREIFF